jgi:hypothetical protein
MRTLDPAVVEAFESGHVTLVTLVSIAFPSQTVRLNSSNWELEWEGHTYLGANGLGYISPITDQPGELPGIQLELLNVDSNWVAVALDEEDEVQGALVTISTAILGGDPLAILDVELDWLGYGDTMSITEDGEKCSIVMTAESKGVDLLRGNPLLYNDADQRSLYENDRIFQYVNSDADKPVIWPKREWFFK